MTAAMTSEQMAHELTEFLSRRPNYGGTPPIESYIQTELQAMARKIASEVVANEPQLAQAIRSRAKEVVYRALREDSYLNKTVTDAIAKVISDVALDRSEDDS